MKFKKTTTSTVPRFALNSGDQPVMQFEFDLSVRYVLCYRAESDDADGSVHPNKVPESGSRQRKRPLR